MRIPITVVEDATFVKHRCSQPHGQTGPLHAAARRLAEFILEESLAEQRAEQEAIRVLRSSHHRNMGSNFTSRGQTMIRYEYATMLFTSVIAMVDTTTERPDGSYVSDDHESREYRRLIEAGFRWVRTDRDFAVFERVSFDPAK